MDTHFAALPPVDWIMQRPALSEILVTYRRDYVVGQVRLLLESYRREVADGAQVGREAWAQRLEADLERVLVRRVGPRRVINATGVVLHTGLGRAPLSAAALAAVNEASAYCDLEFDLDSGRRGSRLDHIEGLLRRTTGCEAAAAVNNNAAAVMLMINSLALGGQVAVSRGELVEIGGSFRIPDIITASGATICEVGTTNRTHLRDYEAALDAGAALILVVHPSNYKISGFTAGVPLEQLAALGRQRGVPLAYDMGGGVLEELAAWGLPHEPVVGSALAAGADLVSFSGDKVLGGPQCGIIVGKQGYIERLRRNPMMRALRCDKLSLAALAATLDLYRLRPELLARELPTLRRLNTPVEVLQTRGQRLVKGLGQAALQALDPSLEPSQAQAGSGALPVEEVASMAVVLRPRHLPVGDWARRLRIGDPAVVGRLHGGGLWLDMRTLEEEEIDEVTAVLNALVAGGT
jgi:L-seryl-tRNA(Ser) seleniumtransferase